MSMYLRIFSNCGLFVTGPICVSACIGFPIFAVLRERDQLLEKLIVNALLHQQPRPGDARLAGRREDARDRAFHRVVDLGIVEHDVRRLAAELHRHALQAARRRFVDALPGRVGSR